MTRPLHPQATPSRVARPRRPVFAILSTLALAGGVVVAVACGGDPEGGDCAVKVTCLAADCKTRVSENACICPEGSKTVDQCATPSADAGSAADAKASDASSDTGLGDTGAKDGSSDATASDAKTD